MRNLRFNTQGDRPATSDPQIGTGPIQKQRTEGDRKGAIIVLAAFMMIALMAMLAFAIDIGYILKVDTDLDRSVDAAALAGAGELINGQAAAEETAVEFLVRNPAGFPVVVDEENLQARISEFMAAYGDELELEVGRWNPALNNGSGGMELGVQTPSAIRVAVAQSNHPFFFGRLFGKDMFTVYSEAVGSFQPRDIMLVLDLSGSMNDDSEFNAYNTLGKEAVDANLEEMWDDLGSPQYGDMTFEPEYLRVKGDEPTKGSEPQIYVTYKDDKVFVESSKDLSNVVLRYSNGATQKFDSLNVGKNHTFAGTGYNSGRTIYRVWVKSGNNASGDGPGYGEKFDFHPNVFNSVARAALGLNGVPYPYQSGSWNSYINWIEGNNQNSQAGYRYKFGYKNLMVYWLEQKPAADQTADLWKVSAQPITAVKNAVDLFVDYVQEVDTDDRMGLAVYNSFSGDGTLEASMSSDMNLVRTISRQRQASHYHNYTNVGAGMAVARNELQNNNRQGAARLMVLMTDGNANWHPGGYSTWQGRQYVLDQAALCKAAKIPVMTISLGAGADTSLMQDVADITDGVHFVVPGGQPIADVQEDLRAVFKQIADDRPLQIIK
ncbi:MAG: VWA domain-containing protein [Pirellulales bacterium]